MSRCCLLCRLIVKANEKDTILIQKTIKNMVRSSKNQAALKVLEMEKQGAQLPELLAIISGKVGKRCYEEGNTDGGVFAVGQAVGLINAIKPVHKVIRDIVQEAESVMLRLNNSFEK